MKSEVKEVIDHYVVWDTGKDVVGSRWFVDYPNLNKKINEVIDNRVAKLKELIHARERKLITREGLLNGIDKIMGDFKALKKVGFK
jgi:hypothetical protein